MSLWLWLEPLKVLLDPEAHNNHWGGHTREHRLHTKKRDRGQANFVFGFS